MRASFRLAFSLVRLGSGVVLAGLLSAYAGCGGDEFTTGDESSAGGSTSAGGSAPGEGGKGGSSSLGGTKAAGGNNTGDSGAAGETAQGGESGTSGEGGVAGNSGASGQGDAGDAGDAGASSGTSGQGGAPGGGGGEAAGGAQAGATSGQGGSDAGAGGSAGCENPTVYYKDFDKDGHGDFTKKQESCGPPPATSDYAWSEVGDDCNDGNADVFPGQVKFFDTPYESGPNQTSFDYDCNNKEEGPNSAPLDPKCGGFLDFNGCNQKKGYKATTTAQNKYCGSKAFVMCFFQNFSCNEKITDAEEPYRCH